MVKYLLYFIFIPSICFSQEALLDDIKTHDLRHLKNLFLDTSNNIISSNFIKSKSISDFKNKKNHFLNDFSIIYNTINNSNLPYSFNDGNFYQARGFQERLSVGLSLRYKWLDVRFQPEYLKVENKELEQFQGYSGDGNWWPRYYLMTANNIDNFPISTNNTIYDYNNGQSRIGIRNNYFAFGISNENIWWGPGFRNSLIFTNNAPGFKHSYLSIPKPINIGIGFLEFYALNGILENTKYSNPDNEIMGGIWPDGIDIKNSSDRLISAFNITLQPKFSKNLFLGLTYANQFYKDEIEKNGTIHEIFSNNNINMSFSSFYLKFYLPEDHAEIYGEFGQQSPSTKIPNIFSDTNRVAFIIGVRKLTPINNNYYLSLGFEFAKLALADPRQIFIKDNIFGRPQINSWYTSSSIKQGYTNQAQLLGASIGPGSNSQSFNISLNSTKKNHKIGLFAERVIHDADFYHYVYVTGAFGNSKSDAYWVDLNWGLELQLELIKNLYFASSFLSTKALNYRSTKNGNEDLFAEPGIGSDKNNLMLNFSIKFNINGIN
jgi:hypothetical protein